jgi:hypothetical protein
VLLKIRLRKIIILVRIHSYEIKCFNLTVSDTYYSLYVTVNIHIINCIRKLKIIIEDYLISRYNVLLKNIDYVIFIISGIFVRVGFF